MQLELSLEEQDILKNLLEQECVDLRAEIRKTENFEFKAALRSKEQSMENLLQKLSEKTFVKTA